MKLSKILLCLMLFVISITSELYSQNVGILSGAVTDSSNGEVLAFCSVYIPELQRGTITDSRGMFLFSGLEPDKKLSVIVSYMGYTTKKQLFMVGKGKMTKVKIELAPSGVDIQEVTVEAVGIRKENATDVSLQNITARDLEILPKAVETDILRSLQYMPGVQFSGDASAQYFVRGGTNNQNLILLDNITVYNPYHALGLFSSIDPEMINNMMFYKGAYPTEYSGRLSSVLKIVTKDGNKTEMGAKASVSFLSAKALIEGPLQNGSFIVTGRKSISSDVVKKFLNGKNYPFDFYDMSAKVNIGNPKLMGDAKFSILGYVSGDKLMNNDPNLQDFKWSNNIIGLNYYQLSKDPLFYNITLSYSRFTGEVIPNATTYKESKNTVTDITGRFDLTYVYESKDELNLGINIEEINTVLLVKNAIGFENDLGRKGTEISIYCKYLFLQMESFGADFGTRFNVVRLSSGESLGWEPRVRLTYKIMPEMVVKFAWGLYKQELTTLSDENEIITLYEPWVITPRQYKPSRAIHYTAGVETEFLKDIFFDVEGYYKTTNDLLILNENKVLTTDPDFVNGTSEAYGAEFQLKLKDRQYNLNLSYTLSWAFNDINNVRYAPRYDARHNLNCSLDINLGGGWRTNFSWIFTSGHPFTQINGYYNKLSTESFFSEEQFYESYVTRTILGEKNIAYLPDYHRLDFTLSKKFDFNFFKMNMDMSLINVYNRINIFYFSRTTGQQVNMLPFVATASVKVEL